MEPKLYEISFILKSESGEALGNTIEQIRKYIEEKSGRSLEESRLIKKRLSYPVGQAHEGFFGNIKFFLKPEDLAELELLLKREGRIIRHMISVSRTYGAESKIRAKKIKPVSEKRATDIKEIDKKLEEILGA